MSNGEQPMRSLTYAKVKEICLYIDEGHTIKETAAKFGVSPSTVAENYNGRTERGRIAKAVIAKEQLERS
jgi:transposase